MARDRRALGLAAFIGGAGITHFVNPRFFDPLVPGWLPGSSRTWTYLSGVAEVASAALLLSPRTRRLGGYAAAATFVGVFPANVQAAIDGGMAHVPGPMGTRAAAIARLPLQVPMVATALKVARTA